MEAISYWAIMAALILAGLGILAVLLFGVRSLSFGKVQPASVGAMLIPAVILVALRFIIGDWAEAAIVTVFVLVALAMLGLLWSGIRGLAG